MRTLLILACLLFLSSCGLFLTSQPKIDYSEGYITGKGTESLNSEQIRKNLTRSFSMAGGNYQIKVSPITQASVNSLFKEYAAAKSLNNKKSIALKKAMEEKFVKDKACIETVITVKEFEAVNKLEQWKIVFIDSNNIAYKLDWLTEPSAISLIPGPITSVRHSYHGKEKYWTLMGQACATARVKMQEGFKLVFKPSFVQWPFNEELTQEWSFDHTKIVEGKVIKVKKKERKKEGYRGW